MQSCTQCGGHLPLWREPAGTARLGHLGIRATGGRAYHAFGVVAPPCGAPGHPENRVAQRLGLAWSGRPRVEYPQPNGRKCGPHLGDDLYQYDADSNPLWCGTASEERSS